jgi:hypothetical protein
MTMTAQVNRLEKAFPAGSVILLFILALVLVAVLIPLFAPVSGVILVATGVIGRRKSRGEGMGTITYDIATIAGVTLLVATVVVSVVLVAHGPGIQPVITPYPMAS